MKCSWVTLGLKLPAWASFIHFFTQCYMNIIKSMVPNDRPPDLWKRQVRTQKKGGSKRLLGYRQLEGCGPWGSGWLCSLFHTQVLWVPSSLRMRVPRQCSLNNGNPPHLSPDIHHLNLTCLYLWFLSGLRLRWDPLFYSQDFPFYFIFHSYKVFHENLNQTLCNTLHQCTTFLANNIPSFPSTHCILYFLNGEGRKRGRLGWQKNVCYKGSQWRNLLLPWFLILGSISLAFSASSCHHHDPYFRVPTIIHIHRNKKCHITYLRATKDHRLSQVHRITRSPPAQHLAHQNKAKSI